MNAVAEAPIQTSSVALETFLQQKEEEYAGQMGNAINFFTTAARELYDPCYRDEHDIFRFDETIDNAIALVAEYPLAESAKQEERILEWKDGDLKSRNGFSLGAMLDRSLDSLQTRDFEEYRFKANKANFDKLRAARQDNRHLHHKAVFVEFSPSPEITTDAIKRGYFGNSCIFFYRFDPEVQAETVEQRWLLVEWTDFQQLLAEKLGVKIERSATDVDIMNASDFFTKDDIEYIEAFIDDHHGRVAESRGVLQEYVDYDLREFLAQELEQLLFDGAQELVRGKNIADYMEQFITALTYAQFRLRNKIAQLTKLNTVHACTTLRMYSDIEIARMDTDSYARAVFMQENREQLQLVGCGVNEQSKGLGGNTGSVFGAFGGMVSEVFMGKEGSFMFDPKTDPNLCQNCPKENPHFHCPECNTVIPVGEGITQCTCGAGKRC